jgi:hypothetical protein
MSTSFLCKGQVAGGKWQVSSNTQYATTHYVTMKTKKPTKHIDDDNVAQSGLIHTVRRPEGDGPFHGRFAARP